LREAGLACRAVGVEATKPNLIAELRFGDGPTLCLNAHLDVVPTGEESAWTHAPFGAELVDGRVYGRGAGDDKASVTAQVMAALALVRSGVPLSGTLLVNAVADEEVGGQAGARLMVDGGHVKADYAIVGEQTQNRVLIGEKGSASIRITIHGRAAHGALPWEGANAIEGMAEVIAGLRRELWPKLEQRTHPLFHQSSASVNLISGGVKGNVVADRCEIYVDRRVVPGEDPRASFEEAAAIARRVVDSFPGLRVEFGPGLDLRAATLTDANSPLVQCMTAANACLGLSTDLGGFSMASDGRFFAAAGVPTIIYGPGDPRLAHVPDEWVGVDELLDATKAYALGALALLSAECRVR
jgi:succinyl-diaminopimelate desuccinylase